MSAPTSRSSIETIEDALEGIDSGDLSSSMTTAPTALRRWQRRWPRSTPGFVVCGGSIGADFRAPASKEFLSSSAPYVAVMDADLQHDATILPKMLAYLQSGKVDIVVGSRHVDGGSAEDGFSARRGAISQVDDARMPSAPCGSRLYDPMGGCFMDPGRDLLEEVGAARLAPSGYKILADIVASSPTPVGCRGVGLSLPRAPFPIEARRESRPRFRRPGAERRDRRCPAGALRLLREQ